MGRVEERVRRVRRVEWYGAVMLFLYAAAFSLAYVSLSAGSGALILFGAVQVTMLVSAIRSGSASGAVAVGGNGGGS